MTSILLVGIFYILYGLSQVSVARELYFDDFDKYTSNLSNQWVRTAFISSVIPQQQQLLLKLQTDLDDFRGRLYDVAQDDESLLKLYLILNTANIASSLRKIEADFQQEPAKPMALVAQNTSFDKMPFVYKRADFDNWDSNKNKDYTFLEALKDDYLTFPKENKQDPHIKIIELDDALDDINKYHMHPPQTFRNSKYLDPSIYDINYEKSFILPKEKIESLVSPKEEQVLENDSTTLNIPGKDHLVSNPKANLKPTYQRRQLQFVTDMTYRFADALDTLINGQPTILNRLLNTRRRGPFEHFLRGGSLFT